MSTKTKKILLMFDLPEAVPESTDFAKILKTEDYKDERNVYDTLRKLGHDVSLLGVFDETTMLLSLLKKQQPDVVFFLCESFRNDRAQAAHLISLLELEGTRFTGVPAAQQHLCRDKALSKKILQFHNLAVPQFVISERRQPLKSLKGFPFPAIVKPLGLEASEGITNDSVVYDEKSCLAQSRTIQKQYDTDVIIEEFIEGRELYVSVIGNDKIRTFPPREFIRNVSKLNIATYKAKWDESYRRRHGIKNEKAKNLSDDLKQTIDDTAKRIYRVLNLRGYARLDFRLHDDGMLYFIEANPNPGISKDDDFAGSAKLAGIAYDELISEIVMLAAG